MKNISLMRKISGTFVFPIHSGEIRYGVVFLDKDQVIQSITFTGVFPAETSSLELYNGVIMPGLFCLDSFPDMIQKLKSLPKRQLFERGVSVVAFMKIPQNDHQSTCSTEIYAFEKKQAVLNFAKENPKLIDAGPGTELSNSLVLKSEKTGKSWNLISIQTIRNNTPSLMFSFYKKNFRKIIYAWNAECYQELIEFLEFFLQQGSGLSIGDVLPSITLNPAQMLQMDENLGSLESGTAPGVVLLEGIDLKSGSALKGKIKLRRLA